MNILFIKLKSFFHKRADEQLAQQIIGSVDVTQSGSFSRTSYHLVHNLENDTVCLEPKPTAEDLRTMYEDGVQFSDAVYTDPERVQSILGYLGGCIATHRLLPDAGGAVLEIGAGLAWMSRAAKLARPGVRTVAQDVSQEAVAQCAWVDHYHVGRMEDMPGNETFDLISLTHVIEHLLDPQAAISLLSKRLKPGGAIFITAPYRPKNWKAGDGIEAWKSYSYLHVPAHISYLSKRFFQQVCATLPAIELEYWDANHEEGQAFEAVLRKAAAP